MATTVGQTCINVTDMDRSVHFYEQIIGLKIQNRVETDDFREVILAADEGGGRLQLAYHFDQSGPIEHGDALWKLYMNVDDCVAVHQAAVDAGFESTMTPERLERWPVIVGFVLDPDGYSIELVQRVDD